MSASSQTLDRIREKKKELQKLVSLNGFTNSKVLRCSQELDVLIYQMQLGNRRC
jgi:hypothetical protein